MGYGLGVFLVAIGLILALAVQDSIEAIDLTMIGWILAAGRRPGGRADRGADQQQAFGHHDGDDHPLRRLADHRAADHRAAGPAPGRLTPTLWRDPWAPPILDPCASSHR